MENCIKVLGSLSECTQAAVSGRAGEAGWFVPLLFAGLVLAVWMDDRVQLCKVQQKPVAMGQSRSKPGQDYELV